MLGGATGKLAVATAASAVVVGCASAYADVTISTAQTQNMNCANGVCAPTATSAVLNVGDLEALLASGNVEVTTTGANNIQADNIDVDAALTWSSASSFALDAYQSITVDQAISVTNQNAVSLTTNDGGSGGLLSFGTQGSMSFASLSSPLTINGTSYTLVNTVKTLASTIASNPGRAYAFASSYDASQDGTYSQSPITTTFEGTLEGLGNAVSNLTVSAKSQEYVGLFSLVVSSGTIRDLLLTSANISDWYPKGYAFVGGLIGSSNGVLGGIFVSGVVKAHARAVVGGLAGTSETVTNCSSAAAVMGTSGPYGHGAAVGGLVGSAGGTVTNSSASGPVTVGGNSQGGGLVGTDLGIISTSFATGKVTGPIGKRNSLGGLVGETQPTGGAIVNSYATGSVSGRGAAGGLIGANYFSVENHEGYVSYAYSTGKVTGKRYVGGFVGFDEGGNGDLTDTYWDTTTSGITNKSQGAGNIANDPGITGLSNKQLKSSLPTGFDPTVWAENANINNGLPYLIANPPPQGSSQRRR